MRFAIQMFNDGTSGDEEVIRHDAPSRNCSSDYFCSPRSRLMTPEKSAPPCPHALCMP